MDGVFSKKSNVLNLDQIYISMSNDFYIRIVVKIYYYNNLFIYLYKCC
jgi:hypothetical protein